MRAAHNLGRFRRRMGADPLEVTGWVRSLPGEVLAGYEAGPTGYGLVRTLQAAGIQTVVLAPSKTLRPAGQKVKTAGTPRTAKPL